MADMASTKSSRLEITIDSSDLVNGQTAFVNNHKFVLMTSSLTLSILLHYFKVYAQIASHQFWNLGSSWVLASVGGSYSIINSSVYNNL